MPGMKDLTGQKFNRLLVINREKELGRQNYVRWNCICDCGRKTIVISNELTRGKTKSCGCIRKDAARKDSLYGESSFINLYNKMKASAKKRGYIFSLSKEEVRKLTKENCSYCGKPPSSKNTGRGYWGEYIYTGIDRVDNSRGYEKDNVVPCCGQCNSAKMGFSIEEFKLWIRRVYDYWGKA